MFWGPLPVKNQSSRRQGAGQMGSRIWASLLIRLEKVAWSMTQVWTSFDLPTWSTSKSQTSPAGAGSLRPVELGTRANSCWGKLAQERTKGQSVLARFFLQIPRYESLSMGKVNEGAGETEATAAAEEQRLLLDAPSFRRRGQWERGCPLSHDHGSDRWPRPVVVTYVRTHDGSCSRALLLQSEKLRSRCLLLTRDQKI